MAINYYEMGIAADKVELIQEVLAALDEATTLIAAFTQTEENQVLLSKLLENIDDVKTIVSSVSLMETTTEDINKGTFLGNRKTDIDIALNKTGISEATTFEDAMSIWNNTANTVYYDRASCIFSDGIVINVDFINDDSQNIIVSTHGAIIEQLNNNTAFTTKLENTSITEDVGGTVGTIIRITDVTGAASNVERIELRAVSGSYVSAIPTYYWALTTSSLQTLANRIGDLLAIAPELGKMALLSGNVDEMLEVQSKLTELTELHANLDEILEVDANTQLATEKAYAASASATLASEKALLSKNKAEIATTQAEIATNKANEIKGITVQAATGAAGTLVQVSYNSTDGKFSFVIPKGDKGEKGDAYQPDKIGTLVNRDLYDAQGEGFSYLANDVLVDGKIKSVIYFKKSDTNADWDSGSVFGQGDQGEPGIQGNGIATIAKTNGDGSSGSTDTYTITMTDSTTFDFNVYNGADSAVLSIAGRTGAVTLTEEDITDLDKYTKEEVDELLAGREPADETILKEADIGNKVLAPDGDASQLTNLPQSGTTLLFEKALFGGL